MNKTSMTAIVSAFSRAYHSENNDVTIFNDSVAKSLFSAREYRQISENMIRGINFFAPDFIGGSKEALKYIVDNQLSPTPLARAAFCEKALKNAAMLGAGQYLIFASGYDTFALRQPEWGENIQVFEIDREEVLSDKKRRIKEAQIDIPDNLHFISADLCMESWQEAVKKNKIYDEKKISFCSILGLSYYMSRTSFKDLILGIARITNGVCSIVFDYPTKTNDERGIKQAALASGANESMYDGYSYQEIEELLSECGFLLYEHLDAEEMTKSYFSSYNAANPQSKMKAFENVGYCLAVKKQE